MSSNSGKYGTAEKRWAGIGPYYAMFPVSFADLVIQQYTDVGDVVLDPFAGRATAVYSAAIHKRIGVGIELNPVGWVYGKAKLFPARQHYVEQKLEEIMKLSIEYSHSSIQMPTFFQHCFSSQVCQFLLAARDHLKWQRRAVDWTTMALLLVYLHGKRDDSLSNQMRQTKSMAPEYAVRWWTQRELAPPEIDSVEFMMKKVAWRYAKGTPETSRSQVYYGDSNDVIPRLRQSLKSRGKQSVQLLFTSPPYCGVTNYHYDQWIRLWMLGFPPAPPSNLGKFRSRFHNRAEYSGLLLHVFNKASKILAPDATVYVRTDSRNFTYQTTLDVLKNIFPQKRLIEIRQPFQQPTQTHLFGDKTTKAGEIDLILEP